jgi:sucrose-6-phosphatase
MRSLLITDLDNTLVGDHKATQTFNQQIQEQRARVCLVYSTGRSLTSFRQLLQEQHLLQPDYLITGVGTGIYHFQSAGLPQVAAPEWLDSARLNPVWANLLSQNWNRSAIAELTSHFPTLVPQVDSEQNLWKLSFLVDSSGGDVLTDALLASLQHQLQQANLTAQVVFSSGRDLDILPLGANKGNAATFLRQQLQIPAAATLVCGDSGNDISLFEHAQLGVIVQNAQSEILEWYYRHRQPGHYLAQQPYAWGILEGLAHFRFLG